VLGHLLLGYSYPYLDNNVRMSRFVMDAMLASGGYSWTVIGVENRDAYLAAPCGGAGAMVAGAAGLSAGAAEQTQAPGHAYPPAGKCIYCGSTQPPLTREHIIPFSFGGNIIFPDASCNACARIINRDIETPIARHEWGAFRVKRDFPSRRRKERKTHITIQGLDGLERSIPIAHHSTPVPMYKFGEARILAGLPPGLGDDRRWTVVMLSSHEEEMAMQQRFPEWNRAHRFRAMPHRFARLIAKIGHGYATAELGIGTFRPLTTDVILGHSDDYYYYVGGSWDIDPAIPGGDHITNISFRFTSSQTAWVVVDIRLFSAAQTPSYHAIVGKIDLSNVEHLRAFERHRVNGRLAPL
jgi:hypothetical protein